MEPPYTHKVYSPVWSKELNFHTLFGRLKASRQDSFFRHTLSGIPVWHDCSGVLHTGLCIADLSILREYETPVSCQGLFSVFVNSLIDAIHEDGVLGPVILFCLGNLQTTFLPKISYKRMLV